MHLPSALDRLASVKAYLRQHELQMDNEFPRIEQATIALKRACVVLDALNQQTAVEPNNSSPAGSTVSSASPMEGPEPRVSIIECFNRDLRFWDAFITNGSLLFTLQRWTFASEAAKVAFAITHLSGKAKEWEQRMPACSSFSTLAAELHTE